MMFQLLTLLLLLVHSSICISVASTPAPYTASSPPGDYASPSTAEPSSDYRNTNHYPYSRQFLEPPLTPNNHLSEGFVPSNLFSPKQFLFHRFPFFPSPVQPNSINPDPTPYPYGSYPGQSPYVPNFPNPSAYDPHFPLPYPAKYPKASYGPDCDYHNAIYRNTKPLLFYPNKPENYYDPALLTKPAGPLYRFQPSVPAPYNNFPNGIYH